MIRFRTIDPYAFQAVALAYGSPRETRLRRASWMESGRGRTGGCTWEPLLRTMVKGPKPGEKWSQVPTSNGKGFAWDSGYPFSAR